LYKVPLDATPSLFGWGADGARCFGHSREVRMGRGVVVDVIYSIPYVIYRLALGWLIYLRDRKCGVYIWFGSNYGVSCLRNAILRDNAWLRLRFEIWDMRYEIWHGPMDGQDILIVSGISWNEGNDEGDRGRGAERGRVLQEAREVYAGLIVLYLE
jgi:hypothetical protein